PTLEEITPPPPPDIAVVAAAKRRKRVPVWAAPVLALLPLWAFLYVYAVRPPPAGDNDPINIGKQVYTANCASCHLADGAGVTAGGTGQELKAGHVLNTFKDPLAMVHWIAYGEIGGARPDGTYGDKDRKGGPENIATLTAQMPAFGTTLSPEELAAVVIYVREEISGGSPKDDPNFNTTTFTADPVTAAADAQAVIDLGPGGNPDLSKLPAAEKGGKGGGGGGSSGQSATGK
ncbi:MAG: cytochrome c, partial [Actinomycetota bacterium]|nr:cytochrome c [Actinomycetota bacterium]